MSCCEYSRLWYCLEVRYLLYGEMMDVKVVDTLMNLTVKEYHTVLPYSIDVNVRYVRSMEI